MAVGSSLHSADLPAASSHSPPALGTPIFAGGMGGTLCRAQLGRGAWVPSLLTSPWGFQCLLDHFATQKRISHQRGLHLHSESSASSHLLSSSCRSKKFDNENGADDSANCLRDGMAPWGWGDGTLQGFKTADECPVGYFASSEGDGRGLSTEPGNTLHRRVSRSSTS